MSFLVVVVSYAIFTVNALTGFPRGEWDGLAYHLPVAVRWMQEGSFAIPSSREWHFSLPGNAEMIMMVLLGTGWQAWLECITLFHLQ